MIIVVNGGIQREIFERELPYWESKGYAKMDAIVAEENVDIPKKPVRKNNV